MKSIDLTKEKKTNIKERIKNLISLIFNNAKDIKDLKKENKRIVDFFTIKERGGIPEFIRFKRDSAWNPTTPDKNDFMLAKITESYTNGRVRVIWINGMSAVLPEEEIETIWQA